MKIFSATLAFSCVLALTAGVASAKPEAVMKTAEEVKFSPVPKAPPAVTMAPGFKMKGTHGAFHKFAAGFDAPLHWHSATTHGIIVAGTVIITPEGGTAKEMGVGSFFSIPGRKKHTTSCKAGTDCIMFVVAGGKFDVKMPKAKKVKAAKEAKEEPKAPEAK